MIDSFIWLIHKTSTFNINLERNDEENDHGHISKIDLYNAVNGEFGAELLPDNMFSCALLFSLSHSLLVEMSQFHEIQRVCRKCGIEASRRLYEMTSTSRICKKSMELSNSVAESCCEVSESGKYFYGLVKFYDRGYISEGKLGMSHLPFNVQDQVARIHKTGSVELAEEVNYCFRLNRAFSRCFRGLIETFALPGLSKWLSKVLKLSPFSYNRQSTDCGINMVALDYNDAEIMMSSKIIRRCNWSEKYNNIEDRMGHSLSIIGAFVSAGTFANCV